MVPEDSWADDDENEDEEKRRRHFENRPVLVLLRERLKDPLRVLAERKRQKVP